MVFQQACVLKWGMTIWAKPRPRLLVFELLNLPRMAQITTMLFSTTCNRSCRIDASGALATGEARGKTVSPNVLRQCGLIVPD